MHKTAPLDSLDTLLLTQIKLEKLQLLNHVPNFCSEFLDAVNAHANYRFVLVGAESAKAEMMVNLI